MASTLGVRLPCDLFARLISNNISFQSETPERVKGCPAEAPIVVFGKQHGNLTILFSGLKRKRKEKYFRWGHIVVRVSWASTSSSPRRQSDLRLSPLTCGLGVCCLCVRVLDLEGIGLTSNQLVSALGQCVNFCWLCAAIRRTSIL